MTPAQIVPAIVVPYIAWRVYVRVRRNIGRQAFRPNRLTTSIVIFTLLTALVASGALIYPPSLAALGGGLLLSVPLAMVGLHLTRFETSAEGKFYTPNTAIGIAVIVLFVGRMAYRLVVLFVAPPTNGLPPPALFQSPLTLLLFGVTAGYYIAYCAGVLVRGKKLV
jgi:hypothetical protein